MLHKVDSTLMRVLSVRRPLNGSARQEALPTFPRDMRTVFASESSLVELRFSFCFVGFLSYTMSQEDELQSTGQSTSVFQLSKPHNRGGRIAGGRLGLIYYPSHRPDTPLYRYSLSMVQLHVSALCMPCPHSVFSLSLVCSYATTDGD